MPIAHQSIRTIKQSYCICLFDNDYTTYCGCLHHASHHIHAALSSFRSLPLSRNPNLQTPKPSPSSCMSHCPKPNSRCAEILSREPRPLIRDRDTRTPSTHVVLGARIHWPRTHRRTRGWRLTEFLPGLHHARIDIRSTTRRHVYWAGADEVEKIQL